MVFRNLSRPQSVPRPTGGGTTTPVLQHMKLGKYPLIASRKHNIHRVSLLIGRVRYQDPVARLELDGERFRNSSKAVKRLQFVARDVKKRGIMFNDWCVMIFMLRVGFDWNKISYLGVQAFKSPANGVVLDFPAYSIWNPPHKQTEYELRAKVIQTTIEGVLISLRSWASSNIPCNFACNETRRIHCVRNLMSMQAITVDFTLNWLPERIIPSQ